MIRNFIKYITILLIIPLVLFAERRIEVSVDKTVTNLRTPINVTIEFIDFSDFPNYDYDFGDDFQVIGGPSQSSNFSWVNGKTTSQKKLIYQIAVKRTGKLTIPSFVIEFKGKNYKTNAVNITVVNQNNTQRNVPNSNNIQNQKSQIGEQLFVESICKNSSVILGESVVVTYRLYTKVDIIDYNIPKIATIDGFMIEEQKIIQNPKVVMRNINGVKYKTADLFNLVLTPTEIGKLNIPPQNFRIELSSQNRSNDPFDSFFSMSRNKVINSIAPAKNINVLKLPNDAPDTFTGAVGNYKLSAKFSKSEVEANQAISFLVSVEGEGNLKNFTFPTPKFPSKFQVFEPKMKEDIRIRNNKVVGKKTWEYVIIPEEKGDYIIPPIKFTYYNLKSKKYITLKKSNLTLKVKRNEHLVEEGLNNLTRKEVELLNQDIRYLYLNESKLKSLNYSITRDLKNWAIYFITLIVVIIFGVYKLYWYIILKNPLAVRRNKAIGIAKKELSQLSSNTIEAFQELSTILNNYISDRLNLKSGEIFLSEIIEQYKNKKVEDNILIEIEAVWKYIEEIKYAPNLIDNNNINDLKERILNLIDKLERIK